MAKVEAGERIKVESAPQKVYEAFMDFENYHQWWPAGWEFTLIKGGNVGAEVMLVRGRLRLMLTVVDVRPGREMQLLIEGDLNGRSTFKFEYQGGQTEINYQMSLQPRSMSLMLLSNVVPYGKGVEKTIRQAVEKLNQQLPARS
ncbi:SRPBCC family protein [Deinococcus roseus]|uniref:Polyketide cyclase n=1 Tax=Deinococcus roseus TaxID=392414 RepID=A0ABQ2CU76_9DEIO|nr:SRPBCC family protein [Deinococcus roseus]GGJ21337.1 hypothetical protein GCM10008938_04440 [Deinococcus roseus]